MDGVTSQKSNGRNRKQRVQTYSDSQLAEEANPPLNAPKWTVSGSGYNGPLKRLLDENEEDAAGTERQRKKKKRKSNQSAL